MEHNSLVKRNHEKQPKIDFPDYKSSIFRAPKNKKISIQPTNSGDFRTNI